MLAQTFRNRFFIFALLLPVWSACSSLNQRPINQSTVKGGEQVEESPTTMYGQKPFDKKKGREVADVEHYSVEGDCDGFPRIVGVKTAPGLCLGLVDENKSTSIPMRRPRAIAAYGDDLIVVDMAGWQQQRGQVFLLKTAPNGGYKRFLLLDFAEFPRNQRRHFYMPSTLQVGPDGKVWVGAAGSIFRFDPLVERFSVDLTNAYGSAVQKRLRAEVRKTFEVVLDDLTYKSFWSSKDSLHPLKPFVFSLDGKQMYLGIGASSDNCSQSRSSGPCPESEGKFRNKPNVHAAIYRYKMGWGQKPRGKPHLVARGVRNSLAMAIDPNSGLLYQGENGRGVRGAADLSRITPPDELNIIREGKHYGWPYCSGYSRLEKEYQGGQWDCDDFEKPQLLIPPHGAPLQMLFYTGSKLPEWYRGRLLVALHGYEEFGHRLISFDRDQNGAPVGAPRNVVYGWSPDYDSRVPTAWPMGVAQASDGSVWITEDKTPRIVRLSVDDSLGPNEIATPPKHEADNEWFDYYN